MNNNALLLLMGTKEEAVRPTIGKAGRKGFGVGIYSGDPADLTAMGLSPMQGCEDPASENYGNYIHKNGSVMVFIPAFCYRIGSPSAPSYSRDAENALEIRDASLGEGDGWILHRAFIDGGSQKLGFFIDKYICSKDPTGQWAVSVKNGDNISMTSESSYINSSSMPGCEGRLFDAITLGRARGDHYSCVTVFQWAALSMLSVAHGQAATSAQYCGWYDSSYNKNFPKGNNNHLTDVNDKSVKWTAHAKYADIGKTGSGTPFNKTTHNGQLCGVTDVNGSQYQLTIGFLNPSKDLVMLAKESTRSHDFTKDNRADTEMFDTVSISTGIGLYFWGKQAFYQDASGTGRALCGVLPKTLLTNGTLLFGQDSVFMYSASDTTISVARSYSDTSGAGVWSRYATKFLYIDEGNHGFRVAGYAK